MLRDVDRYGKQRDRRDKSPSSFSSRRSRFHSRRSRSHSRRSHSRGSRRSRSRGLKISSTTRLSKYVLRVPPLDKQTRDIRVDESDSDRDDVRISRSKRLKKIDVNNPLSAFQVKTKGSYSGIFFLQADLE